MKALVKTAPGPGLTLQQMPDPNPGPSEVVVRVKATSLCGTDAHIYNWDEWAQSRLDHRCGPTGLFAAAVGRVGGAVVIIASDVSGLPLRAAKKAGVDHTLNAKTDRPQVNGAALLQIPGGEGVDAALEMSGDP